MRLFAGGDRGEEHHDVELTDAGTVPARKRLRAPQLSAGALRTGQGAAAVRPAAATSAPAPKHRKG
jgi:hypothetical protein